MPAGSEPPALVPLPHTWRPFGVRLAGAVLGGGLLLVCVLAWVGFDEETRARFTLVERGTLLVFGLLAFLLWFALVRSRVVAEEDRLVVVNGYRRREFEWAEVVAVHLPPGAPWVTLDLADGTTVSAMGIQGSDGNRARRAVSELRAAVEAQSH
jgi:Bacterial PH domain